MARNTGWHVTFLLPSEEDAPYINPFLDTPLPRLVVNLTSYDPSEIARFRLFAVCTQVHRVTDIGINGIRSPPFEETFKTSLIW